MAHTKPHAVPHALIHAMSHAEIHAVILLHCCLSYHTVVYAVAHAVPHSLPHGVPHTVIHAKAAWTLHTVAGGLASLTSAALAVCTNLLVTQSPIASKGLHGLIELAHGALMHLHCHLSL